MASARAAFGQQRPFADRSNAWGASRRNRFAMVSGRAHSSLSAIAAGTMSVTRSRGTVRHRAIRMLNARYRPIAHLDLSARRIRISARHAEEARNANRGFARMASVATRRARMGAAPVRRRRRGPASTVYAAMSQMVRIPKMAAQRTPLAPAGRTACAMASARAGSTRRERLASPMYVPAIP